MKVIYRSNMIAYLLLIYLGHRFELGVWFLFFAWLGLLKEVIIGKKIIYITNVNIGEEDE
jgi:hypothetical protein